MSTAISKFGKLDAVIANAGILDPVGPIKDAKIEEWKRLYDINVFSVVDLVTKAIPELRKSGGGRIIAVLSGASTTSYDGWSAYGSSKAALNHVFQSIAEEEKEFGIRSISVAPGVVDTSMQSDIRNVFSKNMKAEAAQRFTDLHKDGKLLPPQVPGHVYARLALDGWSDELNGKYLRYNDEKLSSYQL